jgi:PPOX class probable F420-dependent enzyme
MLDDDVCQYLAAAPLARLATVAPDGQPHVVPICFAVQDGAVVTPIDEKPQSVATSRLRRVRNIEANPQVALVVDHYADDWDALGWVQLRGTATLRDPADDTHAVGVAALREKYSQYETHALDDRPLVRITPETVRSWGRLEHATPL